MAFVRKQKLPPEQKEYFTLNRFEGGLNNRGSYVKLDMSESPNLMNIDLSEIGVVKKRKGFQKHITEVLNEKIVRVGVHDEFIESTKVYSKKRVRITPTKIYFNDTVINHNNVKDFTTYLGKFLYVDGDKYYVIKEGVKYEVQKATTGTAGQDSYSGGVAKYMPTSAELSDPNKGENRIPPKCSHILVSDKRVIMAGNPEEPNMVYISDLGNILYFPANLTIQLPPTSDKITGIIEFMDAIVVFREYDIHVIYGDDIKTFRTKPINAHTGTRSPRTIKSVGNYLYYLGSDGEVYSLYSVKTDVDYKITKHITEKVDIQRDPINVRLADLDTAFAVAHDNKYFLFIGDKILVQYLMLRTWSVWTIENHKATCAGIYEHLMLIGTENGKLLEPSSDKVVKVRDHLGVETIVEYVAKYDDDGQPIVCWWHSRDIDFDLPSHLKKFKTLFLVAHTYKTYLSTVKVKFEIDYQEIFSSALIRNQIAIWGRAVWGDRFRKKNIAESDPIIVGRMGRILKIIIGNDLVNQPMKVYEINGQYEVKKAR